jgi:hypothetical protein
VRRHEHDEPRRNGDPPPREPEPLPAEAAVLGLQRAAGNRAVSGLLARQPSPTDTKKERKASTSTLGLGDELGVIPLESANFEPDHEGKVHDLHLTFVMNPAVPKIHEAMLKGKPIPEGFYSSTVMKVTLTNIVITSLTYDQDLESGDQIVSMSVNFTAADFQPAR